MVKQLRQAGVPQKAVRALTGISERTIQRIEATAESASGTVEPFRKVQKMGRPSSVNQYEAEIAQWLAEPRNAEDGEMQGTEVLARLRAQGYKGGKSAVYELVRRLRPSEPPVPIVRFEGLPGEFSQHDFGQRRVTYTDGTQAVVRFFVSRLKYSRFVDVQIVENEQQETVIRCLLRAFAHFGGVPLMCVFDNMSSVVVSREVEENGTVRVNWTQRFGQLAMDCGFIPLACYPYRPQQKGSVENLVGFVKSNFFCGRKFRDRAEVEATLRDWVDQVNTERVCDATGEIPLSRWAKESLKACEHQADTYAFKVSVVVRPTARVHYRGLEYSVPSETIGQSVTLHLQQTAVAIYLGERKLCEHPRMPENGRSSVHPEHAEELFRFRRGKPYAQRQLLLDLNPSVEPYFTELVHRRPQSWERDIEQIYELYQRIGRTDLLAAIALATEQRCFGSEYLLAIAQDNPSASEFASFLPD